MIVRRGIAMTRHFTLLNLARAAVVVVPFSVVAVSPAQPLLTPPGNTIALANLATQKAGRGGFLISATVTGTTDAIEAQRALHSAAASACAPNPFIMARYAFETLERADGAGEKSVALRQEVLCDIPARDTDAANGDEEKSSVGYASVAAAQDDLAIKLAASTRVNEQGWLIIEDADNTTLWSFTPIGHAAYPAVVKRQVVEVGSELQMHTTALCEAAKTPCDALMAEFAALDERVRATMQAPEKR